MNRAITGAWDRWVIQSVILIPHSICCIVHNSKTASSSNGTMKINSMHRHNQADDQDDDSSLSLDGILKEPKPSSSSSFNIQKGQIVKVLGSTKLKDGETVKTLRRLDDEDSSSFEGGEWAVKVLSSGKIRVVSGSCLVNFDDQTHKINYFAGHMSTPEFDSDYLCYTPPKVDDIQEQRRKPKLADSNDIPKQAKKMIRRSKSADKDSNSFFGKETVRLQDGSGRKKKKKKDKTLLQRSSSSLEDSSSDDEFEKFNYASCPNFDLFLDESAIATPAPPNKERTTSTKQPRIKRTKSDSTKGKRRMKKNTKQQLSKYRNELSTEQELQSKSTDGSILVGETDNKTETANSSTKKKKKDKTLLQRSSSSLEDSYSDDEFEKFNYASCPNFDLFLDESAIATPAPPPKKRTTSTEQPRIKRTKSDSTKGKRRMKKNTKQQLNKYRNELSTEQELQSKSTDGSILVGETDNKTETANSSTPLSSRPTLQTERKRSKSAPRPKKKCFKKKPKEFDLLDWLEDDGDDEDDRDNTLHFNKSCPTMAFHYVPYREKNVEGRREGLQKCSSGLLLPREQRMMGVERTNSSPEILSRTSTREKMMRRNTRSRSRERKETAKFNNSLAEFNNSFNKIVSLQDSSSTILSSDNTNQGGQGRRAMPRSSSCSELETLKIRSSLDKKQKKSLKKKAQKGSKLAALRLAEHQKQEPPAILSKVAKAVFGGH